MLPVGMVTAPLAGPVLYGFSLGLVAAVNPCGFPLLPAYLMLSAGEAGRTPFLARAVRALSSGATMTGGFLIVFGLTGLAVKLGLGDAAGAAPWIMVPLGVACVVAGVTSAAGRRIPMGLLMPRLPGHRSRTVTLGVFGIGYAVASLSCALPLFLVGVADSFSRRGDVIGLACGLAYALGMGLVVTAVSLVGAGARQVQLGRVRSIQPIVERTAGVVLALVGAYLILYWVTDLVSPFSSPPPLRAVDWAQIHLAGALTASPRLVGTIIGIVVVATLVAAGVQGARGDRARSSGSRPAPGTTTGAPTAIGDRS